MAEEAASFKKEILSIVAGSKLEKNSASAIAPSITYKGVDDPKLPRPRKLIAASDPGREIIVTPGTVPCMAFNTSVLIRSFNSSCPTAAIDPVRFTFFCVP